MKIVKLPRALADLIESAEYYAQDDPHVADRFFDAFEKSIEILRKSPKLGSLRLTENYGEVRMWFVPGFEKCLIFYTESSSELMILRIIHASRDYQRVIDE
jgi:toxin ParE1/3/4